MKTQDVTVQGFAIPTPLSRPLNFFYTYHDAEKALVRVAELYWKVRNTHPSELNWNSLRNLGGDEMHTIIGILERKEQEMPKKVTEVSPLGIITRLADNKIIGYKCLSCSTAEIADEETVADLDLIAEYLSMCIDTHKGC